MEREKVLDFFTKNKMMLEKKALDYLLNNKPEVVDKILEKINLMKDKPFLVSLEFLKEVIKEEKIEIEEMKKRREKKNEISVNDVITFLIQRYEKFSKLFAQRMDFVNLISINKITEKTKKFSLVGIIREIEKERNQILVEDLTGEINLTIREELLKSLVEDEVVGLVCERKDSKIEVVSVLWPDVPLKRIIGRLDEEVLSLFSSFSVFEENFDKILAKIREMSFEWICLFIFSDNYVEKEKIEKMKEKLPITSSLVLISERENEEELGVSNFRSPVFLTVNKKIVLLLLSASYFSKYKGRLGNDATEIMLSLLKKRHLDPVFEIGKITEEEKLFIDPVPDIFVSANFGSASSLNYKGTTIISCGSSEKIVWIVNLKTRETLKIDLT